jgi:hypothetical protein
LRRDISTRLGDLKRQTDWGYKSQEETNLEIARAKIISSIE